MTGEHVDYNKIAGYAEKYADKYCGHNQKDVDYITNSMCSLLTDCDVVVDRFNESHRRHTMKQMKESDTFSNYVGYSKADWDKWIAAGGAVAYDVETDDDVIYSIYDRTSGENIGTYLADEESLWCDDVHIFGNYVDEDFKPITRAKKINEGEEKDINAMIDGHILAGPFMDHKMGKCWCYMDGDGEVKIIYAFELNGNNERVEAERYGHAIVVKVDWERAQKMGVSMDSWYSWLQAAIKTARKYGAGACEYVDEYTGSVSFYAFTLPENNLNALAGVIDSIGDDIISIHTKNPRTGQIFTSFEDARLVCAASTSEDENAQPTGEYEEMLNPADSALN